MKTKIIQNIKIITLGLIVVVGAGYVSAFTAPLDSPPNCPSGQPGCDAPINVGSLPQTKGGPLTVGGLGIVGDLKFIPSGLIPPTAGQVLMADSSDLNNGKVKWGTVSGGGSTTLTQNSCEWTASVGTFETAGETVMCPSGKYVAGLKISRMDAGSSDADVGAIYCCNP